MQSWRLDAPVVRVTVSEDRAVVVRRGKVRLDAGVTHVHVEGVAPVLVDKSVRVEVAGVPAKVGEARVERALDLAIPDDPADRTQAQALDVEIEAKQAAREDLQATIGTVRAELTLLDHAARHTLADVAVDASHGTAPRAQPTAPLEAREKELGAKLVRLAFAARDLDEGLARLRAHRKAVTHPGVQRRTTLAISLSAQEAGDATVTIEYVVPNACWRPQHTATLLASNEETHFATDACVWQATGEPWTEVELLFSTERPSLGKEPPALEDDRLTVQRTPEIVHVETREEQMETAGLGSAPVATKVPGIDDQGEPRVLAAPGRATVPTDGRPHRVPLGAFTAKAAVELVCMPELAQAVIARSVQANASASPMLAGPVDLVRQGGFVGRTTCEFVAPNEKFELGWGPDPGVRVHFDTEHVEQEASLLSGWAARHVRHEVKLSTLDDAARTIRVTLREPVSEIEKVQITHDTDETTEGTKPDADGFVRWDVALSGHGRKQIDLAYVVKHHKDVVGV